MMKPIIRTVLVLFLFATCSLWAQATDTESVSVLIVRGDSLADAWDHQGAAIAYMQALKIEPDNYEALWKAGDQYTELADRLPKKQKSQKETYFTKARELCEKAIEINPDGWEAHFRLSVALGRLALFQGGKKKIRLSKMVKEEAEKAIAINPEADLVYHVLGRWHQNIANLSGVLKFFAKILYGGVPPASNEEAVDLFKKAIEIAPNHVEHHLELGRTYKFMKRKDLARESLQVVLNLKLERLD